MSFALYGCGTGLEELAENSDLGAESAGAADTDGGTDDGQSASGSGNDASAGSDDSSNNALIDALNALNNSLSQQGSQTDSEGDSGEDAESASNGDTGSDSNEDSGAEVADSDAEVADSGAEVADSDAEVADSGAEVADSDAQTDDSTTAEGVDTDADAATSDAEDSSADNDGSQDTASGGDAATDGTDSTAENKNESDADESTETETADATDQGSDPEIGAANPEPDYEVKYPQIGSKVGDVVTIMSAPASKSQQQVQMTPIDNRDGYVYTAHIEPGPNGDSDDTTLRTILRQGYQDDGGKWQWKQTLIEDRTVQDKWHTAPSIAVDNNAHVHVAYNMHNIPWQYKRSASSHDISTMNFKGQAVTQEQINLWKYENRTGFPDLGTADIPGTQVTYPRFEKNKDGELYVTYRFAAKPAQKFSLRMMSTGIAKYDTTTQQWNSIGALVSMNSGDYKAHPDAPDQPTVFAGKQGWTSYLPRLMFGPSNELNVNLYWREGIAGSKLSRPCYFSSADEMSFYDSKGNFTDMPIQPEDCNNTIYPNDQAFYTIGNVAMDSQGTPYLLFSPDDSSRQIAYLDKSANRWVKESSPSNSTEIFFDADDNMYAISSGIKIHRRMRGSKSWETIFSGDDTYSCFPRASLNEDKSIAYIHTHECSHKTVTVRALRLK